MEPIFSLISNIIIQLIRGYQCVISPVLKPQCRFYPTCSQYSIEAIYNYGLLKGQWLIIKRIAKCHPWNCGGEDPVPSKNNIRDY